jgi:hypothetical protein
MRRGCARGAARSPSQPPTPLHSSSSSKHCGLDTNLNPIHINRFRFLFFVFCQASLLCLLALCKGVAVGKMAVPYPPARRFEAKRGGGDDIESAGAQRRYLPRGPALVAVAVVSVSLCCFAALVEGPGRTEDVSVDAANGGASGVPRDAERLIQRAVRKAVAVSCSLANCTGRTYREPSVCDRKLPGATV